jgi:N-methylhydantoinase B
MSQAAPSLIWHAPTTLDEALEIRALRAVRPVAGGTDILPERAARRGRGDFREPELLDLTGVSGLREIVNDGLEWRFGCLVTWTDLLRADLPPLFEGWRAAAREIGGAQIQNAGTLMGNVCTASPAGDGLPCLVALEAEVELASRDGVRRVPIADFLVGRRRTACREDEIATALIVPARERALGAFRKFGARRYLVISIAMASAVVTLSGKGRILRARVVVGACAETPQRLLALEGALTGEFMSPALGDLVSDVHVQHLAPVDDVRASRAYRYAAARELVRETIVALSPPPSPGNAA